MVLCREIGDAHGRCQAMLNLGYIYRRIGRPDRAVEYCRRAMAVNRILGTLDEANILVNLGDAYQQLGRYDDAVDCLEQALTSTRANGDRWVEGVALDILGTVHHRLQNHDDAVAYYHQALDTHVDIGNRWGEAHTLGHLGDVHLATGDRETARTRWVQALSILEEFKHPKAEELRGRLIRLDELPPDAQPDPVGPKVPPTTRLPF